MAPKLPPYPKGDLKKWATALVDYLISENEGIDTETPAKPVLLGHKIDDRAKAITDGTVMYDPALDAPVFSEGGEWRQMATFADTHQEGYGGIVLTAATPIADLGAGWVTLPSDDVAVANPRWVIQGVNGIQFLKTGAWQVNINFTLTHNEVNAGRYFQARLYNLTDGVPIGNGTIIGTGRNTSVSFLGVSIMADVGATAAGKFIAVQVGGGDIYTTVTVNAYAMNVVFLGDL